MSLSIDKYLSQETRKFGIFALVMSLGVLLPLGFFVASNKLEVTKNSVESGLVREKSHLLGLAVQRDYEAIEMLLGDLSAQNVDLAFLRPEEIGPNASTALESHFPMEVGGSIYGSVRARYSPLFLLIDPAFIAALFLPVILFLVHLWTVLRLKTKLRETVARPLGALAGSFSAGKPRPISAGAAAISTLKELELLDRSLRDYITMMEEHERIVREKARAEAISGMISAISHDVRKPFALLKLVLSAFTEMEPSEISRFAAEALPEIDKSIVSVEGLLQDVMQVGSEVSLVKEKISPELIVHQVLDSIFRAEAEAKILIETELDPGLSLEVDVHKSKRIFANIISNAAQAMRMKGRIWICARGVQGGLVEFRIGNEGSHIPTENLTRLFDAFFSAGKKGGTGLGLAIAQKWVKAQGGEIAVNSEKSSLWPNGMVEFTFTLPSGGPGEGLQRPQIPQSSMEFLMTLGKPEVGARVRASKELQNALARLGKPVHVHVVDDEELYTEGVRTTLKGILPAECFVFTSSKDFLSLANIPSDLILVDFDLGKDFDGVDVIKKLRTEGAVGLVALHSNRIDAETLGGALDAGADASFPKPISAEHLERCLLECVSRARI